ncbi:MAG TPA: GH25 family lysozyme [Gaiellaceae bacterium]|nr:GH25 family lysozyme [Gaiellaceae bacterium]
MGVRTLAAIALAAIFAAPATGATYANGVDVSHYQGLINWTDVAATSYRFTFAKATEGTTLVDATYPVNRAGAEGMGLRFGAYHFARPGGSGASGIVASAIAQADFFVTTAQPQSGELPPVLDLEVTGGLAPAALTQWAQAWLDEVKARTGVSGFVYASPNFWKNDLANTSAFALSGYRLWVAHWTKNASPSVPAANWGGLGWTFWQWTDCASVPGFLKCVDGDRYAGNDPGPIAIAPYTTGSPVPNVPPTVVGSAKLGSTLAGIPGSWSGGKPVTFTYQWQRCDAAGSNCTPITGATGETYKPVSDDSGHALVLTVSAQTAAGGAAAASAPTVAVGSAGSGTATRPVATTQPSLAGTTVDGQELSSSVGTWTGSPTSFSYQWRRCDASGASCAAIAGAVSSTYTLTQGDIGATVSLVVTATSPGGSQTATTPPSGLVAAAPVPAAVIGSLAAVAGQAGSVVTADGRATVTWQPGSVPDGSTVTLVPYERAPALANSGVVLGISGVTTALPWPVDVTFATAPAAGTVIGFSTDNVVWHAAQKLAGPSLPAGDIAGQYTDPATALVHVLVAQPLRLAAFAAGKWGDPSLVAAGIPTVYRNGPLTVTRLRDGSVQIRTRVSVASQAHLFVGIAGGATRESLVLHPGSVPIVLRVHLKHGVKVRLRVAAVDPFKRHATLLLPFTAP